MRLVILFCISIISYEVVSADMECLYWFNADEPLKHNPCSDNDGKSYVPENATVIMEYEKYDSNY